MRRFAPLHQPLTSTLSAGRRLLARLRDVLDRKLHPQRRARAKARLSSVTPEAVLFVCLGNICRSPFAERVVAERAGAGLAVDSAGFIGPGRPPPEHALMAAKALGIQHSDHRSRVLTPAMLERADAVFVFDRHNARRLRATRTARPDRVFWLGDFDPEWAGRRAIPDPWGKPVEEFEATFERIERCVEEVLGTLAAAAAERS